MKVDQAPNIAINNINNFPNIIFPVMWLEEVSSVLLLNWSGDLIPGVVGLFGLVVIIIGEKESEVRFPSSYDKRYINVYLVSE